MKQIPLPIAAAPTYAFDNFVRGGNAAAVEHLLALKAPAAPVYLWGPPGCGKTHLLRALAARWQGQGARVALFGAAQPLPWPADESRTLLLLDDCHLLDAARQQAAFALFVDVAEQGPAIVAAGRMPPVDLPLRDDLRSRLGWGHVFALQPVGEAEARAALRREADRRGVFLPDDVMDFLLTRFARDLKSLMVLLDRLDVFALASKRAITVPLLRQMLAEERA